LQRGDRWTWTVRLGAGVLLGTMRDERSGTFYSDPNGKVGGTIYSLPPMSESPAARFAYASPEVRIGRRFGSLELSVGVPVFVLVALTQPAWHDENDAAVKSLGLGFFGEQTVTGRLLLDVAPGLGVAYAF